MRCLMSTERGSWGEMTGARTALNTTTRKTAAPPTPHLRRPSRRHAAPAESGPAGAWSSAGVTVALGPTAIRHPP